MIGSGPAGEEGAAQAVYFDKTISLVEEASSYGGSVSNTRVPGKAMPETALYQLPVNEHFQTPVPHIDAAGDVLGGHALSSTAMEEARVAMVHAFELEYKSGVSPFLPIGGWTIPETSMVGET